MVPHLRTLRHARVQVQAMVGAGFSVHSIRSYLHQWLRWWQKTSELWSDEELLNWLISTCWELPTAAIAAGLLRKVISESGYPAAYRVAAA